MIAKGYKGYIEGRDITTIPVNYLAYPSKNALIHKGVAYTRPGIKNDGNAHTGSFKINGEKVWKDAPGGEKAIRSTADGRLQVKWNGIWITIFDGLTEGALRVRFDTWIDDNGNIIKKRLFFVDGSDKIYEWSGAIATIASIAGDTITISDAQSLEQLGFDPGDDTLQNVQIFHLNEDGTPDESENLAHESPLTDGDELELTSTPTIDVAEGDILVASVIAHTNKLAGIDKDDIYTYKNHVGVAALDSIRVHFSSATVKLDFTVPSVETRTAVSPFTIFLAGNYTAMMSRFNSTTDETVLWVSSVDDWLKVIALTSQDTFGNWVRTERVSQAERTGAMPFAVADYKGDIVFFAQDRSLMRIQTLDVISRDELKLLSDEVEGLLKRLDPEEMRVYYLSRYIYLVFPAESILVMLDMVEGYFQPPQTLGMSHMSIVGGVQYGHSNTRDETFELFVGRNDLGVDIETIFAFGYYAGQDGQDVRPKQHTLTGVACRLMPLTKAKVEVFYENDGAKAKQNFTIDGSKVKLFTLQEADVWAMHPFAGAPLAGAGDQGVNIGKAFVFDKFDAVSWFECRTVITVVGQEQEFHLLWWAFLDESMSNRKLSEDLFIPKNS